MSDLRLYSVNWQDGMLITRQHLQDQEKYFESLARWHAFAAGDHYGLVRKSTSGKPALSMNLSVTSSRLRVEVVRCQALTPDGSYIEIDGSGRDIIRGETEVSETTAPVFIAVDPAAKKQVGDPDPSEDLPRTPYLMNSYSVHLGKRPNMPEGRYIQIAELTISGSEVGVSPGYFPPCLSINADERLSEKVFEFRNRLENMLSLSTRAFMAVSVSGGLAGAGTSLQVAFRETVHLLVYHLASTLDEFVVGSNAGHPVRLVIYFKRLFRVVSSLFNLHPGLKDYLNEMFFTKELGADIGQFLSEVDGFVLSEYNHQDLGRQVRMIDDILEKLQGVMTFLARTKREELGEQAVATETMTYAGRTYRHLTYAASRLERVGELCYLMIKISKPRPISDLVTLMSKNLFGDAEWRNMQVRLGLNEARGLGETDPIDVDTTAFGNKVALHPRDMLECSSVNQITLIFRGASDPEKFANLGRMDLIIYSI